MSCWRDGLISFILFFSLCTTFPRGDLHGQVGAGTPCYVLCSPGSPGSCVPNPWYQSIVCQMCTLQPEDGCRHLWGGFSIAPHARVCRAQLLLVAAQRSPPCTSANSSCLTQIRAASAWQRCCSFNHRCGAGRNVLNTHVCLPASCLPFLGIRWMSSCLRHTQPKSQIVSHSCWRHYIHASIYICMYILIPSQTTAACSTSFYLLSTCYFLFLMEFVWT